MQIRELLKSFEKESELLKNNYNINGVIELSNVNSFIDLIKLYLQNGLIKDASKIKINGGTPYTLHRIDEILDNLKKNDSSEIEVSLFKNDSDNLIVFSIDAFSKTIKNNLADEKTIIDTLNSLFTKNVILIERGSFEQLNYIVDNEVSSEHLSEISKSIKFNSSIKLKVSPYNLNIEKIEKISPEPIVNAFYNLINTLKNFVSLLYITSSFDIKDGKLEFLFDGTRERYFELTNDEVIHSFLTLNKYKDLFIWIYKKESSKKNLNFIEKLDITRNLIASTISSEKGLLEINDNVYDILKKSKSNYKIYLKSKTKDYFELRFKIEEHTDKLFNSLGDEFSKFADFFRNNLYVFVGLLFSSVVFTILRTQVKGSDNSHTNIFSNPDFSNVITIYGILSLIILVITLLKTSFNICDLDNQFDGIKRKYINFIDKKDLVNIIGNSYSKRKKKNKILIIFITIIWLAISFSLIFNKKVLFFIESNNRVEKNVNESKKTLDLNENTIEIDKSQKIIIDSKASIESIITKKTISQVRAQMKKQKENQKNTTNCN